MGDRKSGITFESVVRGALAISLVAGVWYLQATTGGELPEEWQPSYIAVLFLVIIPGYFLWERHQSRRFREAAIGLGMTVRADSQGIRLPFSVLAHERRSPRNMAVGPRGRQEVVLFEFQTGSRRRSRLTHTAVAYRLPEQCLSKFVLRPEWKLVGFLTELVGMKDIDFSASPEFSRNYLLTGRDETRIRMLFKQGLLEFFKRETGWTVEGHDDWLLVYRHGVREKPDRLSQFMLESGRVADVFARLRPDDAPSGVPADDTHDEVTHPMTDEPAESTSRTYAVSFIRGLLTPYGLATMFTVATAVTGWRALGDLLPGRLTAVILIGFSLAVGLVVFAVSDKNILGIPTADDDHR